MSKTLRILQANLRKSRETQDALHNDTSLADFDLILGQEPSCSLIDNDIILYGSNPQWSRFVPTCTRRKRSPVRACIWAAKHIPATQLAIHSPDIAAIAVQLDQRRIVVISVYIPDYSSRRTREKNRQKPESRLSLINRLAQEELLYDPRTEFFIAGDFNRHNPLWGGSSVRSGLRQEESTPIIDFMAELSLESLLPTGTVTYEGSQGQTSTIDLTLATPQLASDYTHCSIWGNEYGSDHRAIHTCFRIERDEHEDQEKLTLKNAPWGRIRDTVLQQKEEGFPATDVDKMVECLTKWVGTALQAHCPRTRPSPYMKRWWNEDLTRLRKTYTYWRNKACARRRQGREDAELQDKAAKAKALFHRTIRRHRKLHWDEFLADTNNIWKAAKYLDQQTGSAFAKIPPLQTEVGLAIENVDIAD